MYICVAKCPGSFTEDLSREIEKIAPESADLKEWNDTLRYLTNMPPASERESARLELINCLKGVAR